MIDATKTTANDLEGLRKARLDLAEIQRQRDEFRQVEEQKAQIHAETEKRLRALKRSRGLRGRLRTIFGLD